MAQWEESEHPRDDEGKFTDGTPAENKRLEELGIGKNEKKQPTLEQSLKEEEINNNKKEQVVKLIQTLKDVKKAKVKDLVNYIKNLSPIKLKIKDDEIIAEFDKFTANKNIFSQGNSDKKGFNYKMANLHKFPKFVEGAEYRNSKSEIGKKSKQHNNVKQWHYFIKDITTDKGNFCVTVNVRDTGKHNYIYEVSFKKKRT